MKVRKGVAYFPTFEAARRASRAVPGSRVVAYEVGWAVQLHKSGPYLGPALKPRRHRCAWCPQKPLKSSAS